MPYAPKTYAEALKTNLKRTEQQNVEDIFQSFTYYLKRLAKKDYTPNDWADIFFNFRHNFHVPASRPEDIDILATTTCIPGLNSCQPGVNAMNGNLDCGKPTISALPNLPRGKILLPPMKLTGRKIMKPSRTFTKEILLKKERALNMKPMKKQHQVVPKRDYTQEEIFGDWLVNLADLEAARTTIQTPKVIKFSYIQEQFFQDWIHNLEEPKMQRAQKVRQSQNMQKAQENKSPKIHAGPLGMKELDYTCEQYFAEWSSNMMECEEVKIIRRPVSLSPPKTPSPTPRLTRKATPPKKKETPAVMNDEVFENYKEDRRNDFNKVNKIKDKKKIQAEKKGTGKRIK